MNVLTTLACLAPAAAIAAVGLGRAEPTAATAAIENVERTGSVSGWHVAADGTVSVRLEDPSARPPLAMWFKSPGDKTQTTRFEQQLLDAVLHAIENGQPLTIVVEQDKERAGRTLDDAFPIVAVRWAAPAAGATTGR